MKLIKPIKLLLTGVAVAGITMINPVIAQDEAEQPEVQQQTNENVTNEFSDFLGDNSETLISSLRNGDDLTYEQDGETVTVENTTGGTSPGEISLGLGLARQELGDDAEYGDIVNFLHGEEGIMRMRADGMGWGQIYDQHGLTVGEVMSRTRANENARGGLDRADEARGNAAAAGRPENAGPNARPDRPERPERPDIPSRGERPDRPDIPARPERPNRPGRP